MIADKWDISGAKWRSSPSTAIGGPWPPATAGYFAREIAPSTA